ncbi:Acidic phospholipase A2 1 [Frankliniella fusca]|uniref:Acidic phospholipase A2 1 n=1 Tax=Frankliniella fusca TaxID=407009 RepID=A0AAE1LRA3_9NEOP|nr:Acidic phospholipase A2 1 [Frankliniella fusca]
MYREGAQNIVPQMCLRLKQNCYCQAVEVPLPSRCVQEDYVELSKADCSWNAIEGPRTPALCPRGILRAVLSR